MLDDVLTVTLILLTMINPVAKVSVLSMLSKGHSKREVELLVVDANIISLLLMLVFASFGIFILTEVFRVSVYSLKIAGGLALILLGLEYLWRGEFRVITRMKELSEIAACPVATPIIAGPATLTTVIAMTSDFSVATVMLASILAIGVNAVAMLLMAEFIGRIHRNIVGAVIRVMGLLVMTIGVQMIVSGFREAFPALI